MPDSTRTFLKRAPSFTGACPALSAPKGSLAVKFLLLWKKQRGHHRDPQYQHYYS